MRGRGRSDRGPVFRTRESLTPLRAIRQASSRCALSLVVVVVVGRTIDRCLKKEPRQVALTGPIEDCGCRQSGGSRSSCSHLLDYRANVSFRVHLLTPRNFWPPALEAAALTSERLRSNGGSQPGC